MSPEIEHLYRRYKELARLRRREHELGSMPAIWVMGKTDAGLGVAVPHPAQARRSELLAVRRIVAEGHFARFLAMWSHRLMTPTDSITRAYRDGRLKPSSVRGVASR